MPSPATRPAGAAPPGKSAGGGKALIGLLGLAVGLVVGYGAGRVSTGTPINPIAPAQERGSQADTDAAQRLREAGLLPTMPNESFSLTGKVAAVTETSLSFDVDLTPFDPTGENGLPSRRTAELTDDTIILRLVEKSPQEVSADQEAFIAASADPDRDGPPPALPAPFKEVPISASDISVGETVTVEAASDILRAETFTATRVLVATSAAEPEIAPAPAPAPEPAPAP